MDFDSIIPFLFVFAFFVLPSILKQIKARKKKAAPSKPARQTPSLFGKLGERIQEFIQELERQAREQKKAARNTPEEQGTVWETLTEDEEPNVFFEPSGRDPGNDLTEDADFDEFLAPGPGKNMETREVPPPEEKRYSRKKEVQREPVMQTVSKNYRINSNPLKNAIIWSEILSKPLALRDK